MWAINHAVAAPSLCGKEAAEFCGATPAAREHRSCSICTGALHSSCVYDTERERGVGGDIILTTQHNNFVIKYVCVK
jgi:hypothetical protein